MDTSTCATVSWAEPFTPCANATMAVLPFPAAVAVCVVPMLPGTVATPGFELAHVKLMPPITASSVSCATAVYACVLPSASSVTGVGVTAMRVIALITVSAALPTIVPAVAFTVSMPIASIVGTSPVASGTAMLGSLLLHVNVVPATGLPRASAALAVNCCLVPR